MRKIYVASSWRNMDQPDVVRALRNEGHEVYDFRNPEPGNTGFSWSQISSDWRQWSQSEYREALWNPIVHKGFVLDFNAMRWADTCVLVLPCGRSAHLEAGWFAGQGRELLILLDEDSEPELMYKMAEQLCINIEDVIEGLK